MEQRFKEASAHDKANTRIRRALNHYRLRDYDPERTLEAVYALLREQSEREGQVLERLRKSTLDAETQPLDASALTGLTERIFTLAHIEQLCVEYRLRFLPAALFQPGIPQSALAEVERLERRHDVVFSNFMIAAPAGMFDLKLKDRDPVLFAQIDAERYVYLHQWGGDLTLWRKIWAWPLRSLGHTVAFFASLAFLISFVALPDALLMGPFDAHSWGIRAVFFFYLMFAFSGLAALYGFSRLKNFSTALWNSPYTD
ncbi:hypothetical protein GC167_06240 [bacterium]|nr:hypothetical protein [bacterium]